MGKYRCSVDGDGIVKAFAANEDQSGVYGDMGTWCDFSFDALPTPIADSEGYKYVFKVVNSEVVARTQEEVDADE